MPEAFHTISMAVNTNFHGFFMDWVEKRKADNMIPMNMGYQKENIMSLVFSQNLLPKQSYPGSRVNNYGSSAFKVYFQTSRISPVYSRLFSWNGY
jgi:hypothetical protein